MKSYVDSDIYEEITPDGPKTFFITLAIVPFALVFKIAKTFFRVAGVLLGFLALIPTLGGGENRNYFLNRVSFCAKDLADWVLYPFALGRFLIKALLAPFRKHCV